MRALLLIFLLIQLGAFGQKKKIESKAVLINAKELADTSIYITDPVFRIYFDRNTTLYIIDTCLKIKDIHPRTSSGLKLTRDYITKNKKAEFLNVNVHADFNQERLTNINNDTNALAVISVFSEICDEMIRRGFCNITRKGISVKKYFTSNITGIV